MKAHFKVKVKRSRYETKYEVAGEPPHGFSASGFVFGVLDDAQIRKLSTRSPASRRTASPPAASYLVCWTTLRSGSSSAP